MRHDDVTEIEIPTPVGPLLATLRGELLQGVRFGRRARARGRESDVSRRIEAYFAGELDALDRIRVDAGGTPFQQRVWAALRCVPAGRTCSYSELAGEIGVPRAVRAVGLANARNPIPLVVPCHRVIGKDGSLTGYGGGLWRKRWLLDHEGARTSA